MVNGARDVSLIKRLSQPAREWIRQTIVAELTRRGYIVGRSREIARLSEQFWLGKLFESLPISCVLDIGANRGQYAAGLRSRVGYQGRIISVEPVPDAFAALEARAASDALWETRRLAIAAQTGEAAFNVMQGEQFSSLNRPLKERSDKRQKVRVKEVLSVPTVTLERFFDDENLSDGGGSILLKLDVQGAEMEALASGPGSLGKIAAVQVELAFIQIYEGGADWRSFIDWMDDRDFVLSGMFPNNAATTFPHLFELDALFVRRDLAPPV